MTDLENIWQQESNGTDSLESLIRNKKFMQAASAGPLSKLKRNLAIHLVYAVIITVGYAYLIYYFPVWPVQLCMVILIGFNMWAIVKAWKLHEAIDLNMQNDVLSELKKHHAAFTHWFRQSMFMAALVYPFATAGGFMLGGVVGSGKPVEAFMGSGFVITALAVCIALFVPLGLLLAKWMNKIAFGRYVSQLKERIDELEGEG